MRGQFLCQRHSSLPKASKNVLKSCKLFRIIRNWRKLLTIILYMHQLTYLRLQQCQRQKTADGFSFITKDSLISCYNKAGSQREKINPLKSDE